MYYIMLASTKYVIHAYISLCMYMCVYVRSRGGCRGSHLSNTTFLTQAFIIMNVAKNVANS